LIRVVSATIVIVALVGCAPQLPASHVCWQSCMDGHHMVVTDDHSGHPGEVYACGYAEACYARCDKLDAPR
jgi:hypothetical protein